MNIKKRRLALILVPALLLTMLQSNAADKDNILALGNCRKAQHKSWPWYADSLFKIGFKWATDQIDEAMGRAGYGDYSGGNWNFNLKKCTRRAGFFGLCQWPIILTPFRPIKLTHLGRQKSALAFVLQSIALSSQHEDV